MSATLAARYAVERLRPVKGETLDDFAIRMQQMQTEVYSAYAGSDLNIGWGGTSEKDRNGWRKWARELAPKGWRFAQNARS